MTIPGQWEHRAGLLEAWPLTERPWGPVGWGQGGHLGLGSVSACLDLVLVPSLLWDFVYPSTKWTFLFLSGEVF